MRIRKPIAIALCGMTCGGGWLAWGDDAPRAASIGHPQAGPTASVPKPSTPTAEAVAQALDLVRLHLPELAQVLEPLQATNPAEYHKAMGELAAEARTLADLRAKNPARADLALADWKARTRVEFLAAQLAGSPSPERESQLRQAIEERLDVAIRHRRFEFEQNEATVARLRDRLAQAEANRDKSREALKRAETNRVTRVETQLRALMPKPRAIPAPSATRPNAKPVAPTSPPRQPATALNPPGTAPAPASTSLPLMPPRSPAEGAAR